jgi:molybdenum-dependent DNA-binding transcriptional regulator ModE
MNLHLSFVRTACAIGAGFVCAVAGAANLSPAAYTMATDEVKAAYKSERDACNQMNGNAKDICVETAKGKEKVAMANLQYQRSGDAKDMAKLAEARYDARYELAKEVCDDQAGNAKDVCVAKAKADHEKAKADAKLQKSTAEARTDAAQAKDKADYAVASQRCDNMSGDAKSACMASARARYGQ